VTASFAIQALVLTLGIYAFLRFLRTTRGSGVLNGLVIAGLVVIVGLWGLADFFQLEEFQYIVQGITPFLAVILAILFQPELRRAMIRLGERNQLANLFNTRQHESVVEVAQAAIAMAARRHGALVAFQRDTALDAYTQNAVQVDAEVNRLLLENLFHPGSALHDGAVVITGDRVSAAACLFPLTENVEISKSTGTRHRAALGLTEETDAVTLIVSEETGNIAICRRGHIERDIPPARIEERLRHYLGYSEREQSAVGRSAGANFWSAVRALFAQDLLRKGAAAAMAFAILYLVHQDILEDKTFSMTMRADGIRGANVLSVQMPSEQHHLAAPVSGRVVEVQVRATRSELARLNLSLAGSLSLSDDTIGSGPFPLDQVEWTNTATGETLGLDVRWKNEPLTLTVERYAEQSFTLVPENLDLDDSTIDARYRVDREGIVFTPSEITLVGPQDALDALLGGGMPLRFQRKVIGPKDRDAKRFYLSLSDELTAASLRLSDTRTPEALVPIIPDRRELGFIQLEITKVKLDPNSTVNAADWSIPPVSELARFRFSTEGIFNVGDDPGTPAFAQRANAVQEFVERHLHAMVDVSDLDATGSKTARVIWIWPPSHIDWWTEFAQYIGEENLDPEAAILLELESDPEIRLTHVGE